MEGNTKFCKFCGEKIPQDAIICTKCGRQVEEMKKNNDQPIVINNTNMNSNINNVGFRGTPRNKWVALILCAFLGVFGVHKFYEGKAGMGVLYLLTFGLCFFGVIIDLIIILMKPTTYYV